MKKHMQDLSNKISREGLEHNELWGTRIMKVKCTSLYNHTHNVRYVPPFPFNYWKNKFSTFLVF